MVAAAAGPGCGVCSQHADVCERRAKMKEEGNAREEEEADAEAQT